jgi:hypothetical protein
MSESLSVLERKRAYVLEQIAALGDLRPGSLTTTQGKCGKTECCCREPGHPGHGPHWRITFKVEGKSRSEGLYEEAAIKKAEREIDEPGVRRSQYPDLPRAAFGDTGAAGKKTADAIQEEVASEIARLLEVAFADWRKKGQHDLEALEMATRSVMHRAGAAVIEKLLNAGTTLQPDVACGCGQRARFHQRRSKQLVTALGSIRIERGYYICEHCRQGQSPRDRELDVEGTAYSPAVRRMMALVGSEGSFEQGRQQLEQLAGLEVTTKAVERQAEDIGQDIANREQAHLEEAIQLGLPQIQVPPIPFMYVEMDGTGIPVVAAETEGRHGKTEGQPAHTREVKLGCVSPKPRLMKKAGRFATTALRPTREPSKQPITLDGAFIEKLGIEAGKELKPEWF